MSMTYALKAEARERAGKGVARAIRRDNKVPGVIYGDAKETVMITLPSKELTLEYLKGHMMTGLCDLDVGGKKQTVLARDVQLHPVTDRIEHVDFLRVGPKTKIAVKVPVHFINEEECIGIKNGGALNVMRHEIEVLCSAMNIPESFEVDLTPFDMDDAVKVSHIKMDGGVKPTDKTDPTIAAIHQPRAYVEEEPVAEEGATAEGGEAKAEGDEGEAKE